MPQNKTVIQLKKRPDKKICFGVGITKTFKEEVRNMITSWLSIEMKSNA